MLAWPLTRLLVAALQRREAENILGPGFRDYGCLKLVEGFTHEAGLQKCVPIDCGRGYTWHRAVETTGWGRGNTWHQNCKQLFMYMNNWDKGVALAICP